MVLEGGSAWYSMTFTSCQTKWLSHIFIAAVLFITCFAMPVARAQSDSAGPGINAATTPAQPNINAAQAKPGTAANVGAGNVDTSKLAKEMAGLFVVATLLEFALAVIFQWRVYRLFFNARATKTLVTVAAALLLVKVFDYPIFERIIEAAGASGGAANPAAETGALSSFSAFLSALVLSGGSAGINQLMRNLGLRAPEVEQPAPQPANDNEAWVSVTVRPSEGKDNITVRLESRQSPPAPGLPPVAALIDQRKALTRAAEMLFASSRRWPPSGGKVVESNKDYCISVAWDEIENGVVVGKTKTVFAGRFAPRAVVDLVARI